MNDNYSMSLGEKLLANQSMEFWQRQKVQAAKLGRTDPQFGVELYKAEKLFAQYRQIIVDSIDNGEPDCSFTLRDRGGILDLSNTSGKIMENKDHRFHFLFKMFEIWAKENGLELTVSCTGDQGAFVHVLEVQPSIKAHGEDFNNENETLQDRFDRTRRV